MNKQTEAMAVAESFLHKDFANVPLNLSVDPADSLQEAPDLKLWQDLQIKDYEVLAPFVCAGQLTLEVSVDFAKPQIPSKVVYLMVDMDEGNALSLYKGVQGELRKALNTPKPQRY